MGKKASKRKQKMEMVPARPPGGLAAAVRWPFYEVLIAQGWDEPGALVTVIVARCSPEGKIAVASFLVDLGCLGVKSALVRSFKTLADYWELRQDFMAMQPLIAADVNLAAKIIAAGAAYAADLGFKPDPVFHQAEYLLTGADPDACTLEVPLGGPEGKPCFVAGPYDDVQHIIDHLTRHVGEGNFDIIAPLGPPDAGF